MGSKLVESTAGRKSFTSLALGRILDHHKKIDYVWLLAFATLPILLAVWAGNLSTTEDGFAGFGTRLNWTVLTIVLPTAVFFLRWMAKRIYPVSAAQMPASLPPVIGLVETDAGRRSAYAALRRAMLAPANLAAAFVITLLIHVFDMAQLSGVYLSDASVVCSVSETPPAPGCVTEVNQTSDVQWLLVPFSGLELKVEKDWSVAYLSSKSNIEKWRNLTLVASAYSVQFASIFAGILGIVLILRHNLYFLFRIYQRRVVAPGDEKSYIHIDLDDDDKCFGFRRANDAFNVQVLALAVSAALILYTRFANVEPATGLFPDVGQVLVVLSWLFGLAIISLPILIKLLPRLPLRNGERTPASLVGYLREFLSDEDWAVGKDTSQEEINAVAARFAENAFWPTGNNRAWQLYFLSFWVFFVALIPDYRAIPLLGLDPQNVWGKYAVVPISGAIAGVATWGLFRFLRAMLAYIDNRLVEPPASSISNDPALRRRKIPIGVFVSYRRDDTAAYTGRLYDSLSNHINKDKLFMDLDKIPGGVDFVETIKEAIGSAQAMIVVIGPEWLTIARDNGLPRIEDPGDFVHQEIALGLSRNIRVLPVLVGRATMPTEAELPAGLKSLALRNAREISNSRWDHDVGLLMADIEAASRSG